MFYRFFQKKFGEHLHECIGNLLRPFAPFDLHDLDRPSTLLRARLHVRLSTLLVVNLARTFSAMYLPILSHLRPCFALHTQPCASLLTIMLHVRDCKCDE